MSTLNFPDWLKYYYVDRITIQSIDQYLTGTIVPKRLKTFYLEYADVVQITRLNNMFNRLNFRTFSFSIRISELV